MDIAIAMLIGLLSGAVLYQYTVAMLLDWVVRKLLTGDPASVRFVPPPLRDFARLYTAVETGTYPEAFPLGATINPIKTSRELTERESARVSAFRASVVSLLEGLLPLREVEVEFLHEAGAWQVQARCPLGVTHTLVTPVRIDDVEPIHSAIGERILASWERYVATWES